MPHPSTHSQIHERGVETRQKPPGVETRGLRHEGLRHEKNPQRTVHPHTARHRPLPLLLPKVRLPHMLCGKAPTALPVLAPATAAQQQPGLGALTP